MADISNHIYSLTSWNCVRRWYKIDIHISWENQTYNLLLDDTVVAQAAPFKGDDVDGIRISMTRATTVWYDEIYIGFDNMMSFSCPAAGRRGTSTVAPPQRSWSYSEVHGGDSPGYTAYHEMTRHYNHLKTVNFDAVRFDGQGPVKDNQDIKLEYPDGDYPITQGTMRAGALMYISNTLRSAKTASTASTTRVSPVGLW